jgi:molybdopterin converting factor small subunit
VDAVMRDLDRRFEGLRFRVIDEQGRIRRHMRIFVGLEQVESLDRLLHAGDEVLIFGALSGG